jgi:hypothetical protein
MAHKGKAYPVALRRDVSLNTPTYRFALPHQYDITSIGTAGTVGGPMSGLVVRVTEKPDPSPILIRWDSVQMHISGHDVTIRIDAEVSGSPAQNFLRCSCVDATLGIIWQTRGTVVVGSGGPCNFNYVGNVLIQTPGLFQVGATGPPVTDGFTVFY